ncbi:FAD-dependent oxidoreductase [Blastopirellula sp. JC732]|uniref:FAD-dependent oxidoreductase n=1 Tax=Blastopirellula sediminis TaxID=2894196 RepID=A0A9X1MLX7_9BACT|nr:FAD-dependent oxidoreductase [Blastopirellula sediminis]MCC9608911.1 FAD-dependent oxidoreductase [Blastopirellula sediminis]MCC9628312.1 FAD-dependent oxidoreductase [Blastopirellula sediminis]
MSNRPAVVIGGGVVGAAAAYYLAKSGRKVVILEKGTFGAGCSHANCGYVSPSHVLPLAQPGVLLPSMLSMLQSNSPFAIRFRFSPSLWSWLTKFALRCRRAPMMQAAAGIHALLQSSRHLYSEIIAQEQMECEFEERGLLFVFQDKPHFDEFGHVNELLAREFNVVAAPYVGEALNELEPALKPGLAGGWLFGGDAHLRPDRLMTAWRTVLERMGVEIRENCEFQKFTSGGKTATAAETSTDTIEAEDFLIAAGAWTPFLNDQLGCKIPIQPGKGYSMTMPRPEICPKFPMLLEQHHVGVTPWESGYRLGSTMEFAGYDTRINEKRLGILTRGAEVYLKTPHCEPILEKWYGWRPMTPDSTPYIDRSPKYGNVYVAAGHNMLGLSMSPGTGKLIAEIMNDETPHLDATRYSLKRKI